jgi:hypothetical protein
MDMNLQPLTTSNTTTNSERPKDKRQKVQPIPPNEMVPETAKLDNQMETECATSLQCDDLTPTPCLWAESLNVKLPAPAKFVRGARNKYVANNIDAMNRLAILKNYRAFVGQEVIRHESGIWQQQEEDDRMFERMMS